MCTSGFAFLGFFAGGRSYVDTFGGKYFVALPIDYPRIVSIFFFSPYHFTYNMLCPQRHFLVTNFAVSTWGPLLTWLSPAVHWTARYRVATALQVLPQVEEAVVLVLHLRLGLRRDIV